MKDAIGQAISDFYSNDKAEDIVIQTNYTEDELLSPAYFFRTEKEMPAIEKTALKLSFGKILDIGAAAGSHSLLLQERGLDVTALEQSVSASEVMVNRGVKKVVCADLFDFHEKEFNTILLLMNGAGIGGTIEGLKRMLVHIKSLLTNDGQILIDSSDISYLFEEDDGSVWFDLANDNYFGEMNYKVIFKNTESDFKWLFVDYNKLSAIAKTVGLKCEMIEEGIHFDYLARLFF